MWAEVTFVKKLTCGFSSLCSTAICGYQWGCGSLSHIVIDQLPTLIKIWKVSLEPSVLLHVVIVFIFSRPQSCVPPTACLITDKQMEMLTQNCRYTKFFLTDSTIAISIEFAVNWTFIYVVSSFFLCGLSLKWQTTGADWYFWSRLFWTRTVVGKQSLQDQ